MISWKVVREKESNLSDSAMEAIQNVRMIRSYVIEDKSEEKLTNAATDCYKTWKKHILINSSFGPTFRSIVGVSHIIAYSYGIYLIFNNQFSIGDLITFNLLLAQFASPVSQLGNQVVRFFQSKIGFDRVCEVLNNTPAIIDKENSLHISNFERIEFKDYSFKYPNTDVNVLHDINLTITNGKSLGIVGKTGSGKTTLIRQLLRKYKLDTDNLLYNGISVNEYYKEDIRRLISYVPQEHQLFARTIKENIELGSNINHSIDLEYATKMACFDEDVNEFDDKYDTLVGEYGVTLSGGQKQRLSIARAFMKDSDILILDDSLSAVDGTTEAKILKNIKEIRKNKTNVIVSHRLTAVSSCDEIIVLDSGKIVERGSHNDLMQLKGWYYNQYIIQESGGEKNE